MREFSFLILLFIAGCSMTRTMQINTAGDNIDTVYGKGNINATYISNTTYGFMK